MSVFAPPSYSNFKVLLGDDVCVLCSCGLHRILTIWLFPQRKERKAKGEQNAQVSRQLLIWNIHMSVLWTTCTVSLLWLHLTGTTHGHTRRGFQLPVLLTQRPRPEEAAPGGPDAKIPHLLQFHAGGIWLFANQSAFCSIKLPSPPSLPGLKYGIMYLICCTRGDWVFKWSCPV